MTIKREQMRLTALSLLQRSLELLDEIDDLTAACHVQHAIDVMTNAPRTMAEAEAMLDSPAGRALQKRFGWPV